MKWSAHTRWFRVSILLEWWPNRIRIRPIRFGSRSRTNNTKDQLRTELDILFQSVYPKGTQH